MGVGWVIRAIRVIDSGEVRATSGISRFGTSPLRLLRSSADGLFVGRRTWRSGSRTVIGSVRDKTEGRKGNDIETECCGH